MRALSWINKEFSLASFLLLKIEGQARHQESEVLDLADKVQQKIEKTP
tara:strand:- start:380 stop:523 length:144 start_codon:yes stop_codon:yes gene_type:complete